MTNIYIVKENYTDMYKNEEREFLYKFENMSGAISFVEDSKNKSFALEQTIKIYKFELNNDARLIELEKELGI